MTKQELRQELSDRGFDDLSSTRLDRYLNQSYAEICNYAEWPFLETQEVINAGTPVRTQLTYPIGSVLFVFDAAAKRALKGTTEDWLWQNVSADLTATGTAAYWYLSNVPSLGEDDTTYLNVYPLDTTTDFTISYLIVPAELTNDTDEPLIPNRFQDLIINRAAIKCYRDNDNHEAANDLRKEYDLGLEDMARHCFARNLQNPDRITEIAQHE